MLDAMSPSSQLGARHFERFKRTESHVDGSLPDGVHGYLQPAGVALADRLDELIRFDPCRPKFSGSPGYAS